MICQNTFLSKEESISFTVQTLVTESEPLVGCPFALFSKMRRVVLIKTNASAYVNLISEGAQVRKEFKMTFF